MTIGKQALRKYRRDGTESCNVDVKVSLPLTMDFGYTDRVYWSEPVFSGN